MARKSPPVTTDTAPGTISICITQSG
jgi:hypothetical protein